jgi:hypothetical protein
VLRCAAPLALWHVTARTAPEHNHERYRECPDYIHGIGERILAHGRDRVRPEREGDTIVTEGDCGERLAEPAGARLVVCGSRGYGPAGRFCWGVRAEGCSSTPAVRWLSCRPRP